MRQNNVVRLDEVRLCKQLEKLSLQMIIVDEIQRMTAVRADKETVDGLDVKRVESGNTRGRLSFAQDDMIASLWKISGGVLGIALGLWHGGER